MHASVAQRNAPSRPSAPGSTAASSPEPFSEGAAARARGAAAAAAYPTSSRATNPSESTSGSWSSSELASVLDTRSAPWAAKAALEMLPSFVSTSRNVANVSIAATLLLELIVAALYPSLWLATLIDFVTMATPNFLFGLGHTRLGIAAIVASAWFRAQFADPGIATVFVTRQLAFVATMLQLRVFLPALSLVAYSIMAFLAWFGQRLGWTSALPFAGEHLAWPLPLLPALLALLIPLLAHYHATYRLRCAHVVRSACVEVRDSLTAAAANERELSYLLRELSDDTFALGEPLHHESLRVLASDESLASFTPLSPSVSPSLPSVASAAAAAKRSKTRDAVDAIAALLTVACDESVARLWAPQAHLAALARRAARLKQAAAVFTAAPGVPASPRFPLSVAAVAARPHLALSLRSLGGGDADLIALSADTTDFDPNLVLNGAFQQARLKARRRGIHLQVMERPSHSVNGRPALARLVATLLLDTVLDHVEGGTLSVDVFPVSAPQRLRAAKTIVDNWSDDAASSSCALCVRLDWHLFQPLARASRVLGAAASKHIEQRADPLRYWLYLARGRLISSSSASLCWHLLLPISLRDS